MIKTISKIPIFYFFSLVILYTIYDYFEHITRTGSTFEEHPWYWLWFTASAISSLILVVLLFKMLLEKIFKKKNLIFEVIAIGIWLYLYIMLLGPVIDRVCWPFDSLIFGFNLGPFAIIVGIFLVLRIVINLFMRKGILYSK